MAARAEVRQLIDSETCRDLNAVDRPGKGLQHALGVTSPFPTQGTGSARAFSPAPPRTAAYSQLARAQGRLVLDERFPQLSRDTEDPYF